MESWNIYKNLEDSYSLNLYNEFFQDYFIKDIFQLTEILRTVNMRKHKSFFKDLGVNTPYILNQTKSLKRTVNHTNFLSLAVYLARKGKKVTCINLVSNLILSILYEIKNEPIIYRNMLNLQNFLFFYSMFHFKSSTNNSYSYAAQDFFSLKVAFKLKLPNETYLDSDLLYKSEDLNPKSLYNLSLKKLNFLFAFYIYKVDKNIYKNSRGRSGKFTFVWKYVAPYKRHKLIAHWLMKEVRVAPGKTLEERLKIILRNFLVSPKDTLVWKVNRFSVNYVYYYLRRSLGETCRTTMN